MVIELKKARIKSNMTQQMLSEKSGVSRTVIANIETGRAEPSRSTAIALANVLEMNPWDLFDWSDEKDG